LATKNPQGTVENHLRLALSTTGQDAGVGTAVESGRVLAGRYRLHERLGRGGFGEVWRAEDTALGRDVAVKTLLFARRDESGLKRFEREARALARLNHPNVVAVFDTGVDGDTGYLVMQLLSGPSLGALLGQRGPLPVDLAVEYARQAAAGLSAAHHAGLVHRDVSPANLILDSAGTVKLADFGVARLDDSSMPLTVSGTVFATPGYVSPEQAAGRPADARSDLYALGCVLYTLIAGEPPFTAEHPIGVVQQHLTSPPPHIGARHAAVSAALDDLLTALLAKDPADRPASADGVAARLAALRGGSEDATVPLTAATVMLPPRRPSTRQWLLPVIALAVIALGVGLAIALTENDHAAAPATHATTTAASATTTAPAATTAPTTPTTTAPAAPQTPAQSIAAAGSAISQAQAQGRLDPKAAADLQHHLDDITKGLGKPDTSHKVGDFLKKLDDLARKGQVTSSAAAAIAASLSPLASESSGSDDSPQQPHAEHPGKHKSHH
jgi:eukaryotic-like serine/threonine-protein kinase